MFWCMVFGEVIGPILFARNPFYCELVLVDLVAYPMIAHVYRSRSLLFDGVVGYTIGGRVIGVDKYLFLGITHFMEGSSKYCSFFAIDE